MPKKEVVDYIKKQLGKGHHIDKVKGKLVSRGHKRKHVESAVAHINKKKFTNTIILISLFLISLLIVMLNSGNLADQDVGADIEKVAEAVVGVVKEETVEPGLPPELLTAKTKYEAAISGDVNDCGQLNSEEQSDCKDKVYYKKAMDEDNVELCGLIQSESNRIICSDFYYIKKGRTDKSFCDKIINPRMRSSCEG